MNVISTQKRYFLGVRESATGLAWEHRLSERQEQAALAIAQGHGVADIVARVLAGRGVTPETTERFLDPTIRELLPNPASLTDMTKAASRIAEAIVRGDEVMLQQVVVNLMRNALDALRTDPPEDPQVTLRLVLRPGEAEVQVCDNGCGLGDDAAAKLFVPFASSKPSGMGIGLSICRSFVELHQGRLWFSRNADRGATFHVSLPRMTSKTESTAP